MTTEATWFHDKGKLKHAEIRSLLTTVQFDDSYIRYFCGSLMILIVGRWRMISFSNFRLKIFLSGTNVNLRIQAQKDFLSFIFFLPTHCKGSNSLKILGIWRDQKFGSNLLGFLTVVIPIFSVLVCYEQHSVFLLRYYLLYSHFLVYFLSFHLQM